MRRSTGWLATSAALAALLLAAGCKGETKKVVQVSGGGITIPPYLQDLNIIGFHLNISATSESDLCIACHGDKTDRVTEDPITKEFHDYKHERLASLTCIDCHGKVDLINKSGANIRKQVDVEARCHPCHGPGGTAPRLYQ